MSGVACSCGSTDGSSDHFGTCLECRARTAAKLASEAALRDFRRRVVETARAIYIARQSPRSAASPIPGEFPNIISEAEQVERRAKDYIDGGTP